jgi:vancomycin resistance protein YoaR
MIMQNDSSPSARTPSPRLWLKRLGLVGGGVLIAAIIAAAIAAAVYQGIYREKIFPGVRVWGVDLGGMTLDEAETALRVGFDYPQTATFTLYDGEQTWPVTAGDLGVRLDVDGTLQEAYGVGRGAGPMGNLSEQMAARREGVALTPSIDFDRAEAEAFIGNIAAQIDQPAINAVLNIDGMAVIYTPGQIAREVDVAGTIAQLEEYIRQLESARVPLVVVETPPAILDAEEAAEAARAILADDLTFIIAEPRPEDSGMWTLTREELVAMLVIAQGEQEEGRATYEVSLDTEALGAFLQPLASELAAEAVNPRFDFDEETGELTLLSPGLPARALDIDATVALANAMAPTPEHEAPLVFETIPPEVADTATAEELGITELISSATTTFRGSDPGRVHNIATAAARFNGLVIVPGEEVSFAHYLGDVSEETGFVRALIIWQGSTIMGEGGGTCQVSTTAFQAAFYGGYPITERWPHGYRVGYYETGEGVGMDATVYAPEVDLRFVNDTPYHLLIETETDTEAYTLTFNFYSTSDGRTVRRIGPEITNRVQPETPLYIENPNLPAGTIRQIDYEAEGADVTIIRIVSRDGEELFRDVFFSQYQPWRAVYEVPPGWTPPEAEPPEEEEEPQSQPSG